MNKPVKEHTTTLMESRAKIFSNEAHPVKLTDEEIYKTIFESGFDKELFIQNISKGIEPISLVLARAILRKAQEK